MDGATALMRLLILGGTAWLGGHVAKAALREGHEVICLARGVTNGAPSGSRFIQSDRTQADAYDKVVRGRWDAVVDVSRQPGQVRRAAAAFADRCASFVFVSSASVYLDKTIPGENESAALLPALAGDVMESMQTYGEAKVACEQEVLKAYGSSRSFIARAGLIGGPGDTSDRTGYWPIRFARPAVASGTVLVPDAPALMTQILDVRDLADWIVKGASCGLNGVFNATAHPVSLTDHLELARKIAGHASHTVAVSQDWLLAHEVKPWAGARSMPLWLPMPAYAGFGSRDNTSAVAAGLVIRPLETTLEDVLAWELDRDSQTSRQAGLSDEDERELLSEFVS